MDRWVVWGARGHAAVVIELISILGGRTLACFDNDPSAPNSVLGTPNLGGIDSFYDWVSRGGESEGLNAARVNGTVAIGGWGGADRLELLSVFHRSGLGTPPLVHPSAVVAPSARIGRGAHVLAQSHVGTRCRVGRGCIINSGASLDHDSIMQDGAHLAPGSVVCGEARIGSKAFVGAGATVLPRIEIGEGAGVGAGSTVTNHVEPGSWVWGVPARMGRQSIGESRDGK